MNMIKVIIRDNLKTLLISIAVIISFIFVGIMVNDICDYVKSGELVKDGTKVVLELKEDVHEAIDEFEEK